MRPLDDSHFDFLAHRYGYLREFAPAFLQAFTFRSNLSPDPLLQAVELLRTLNQERRRVVPENAPLKFIPATWHPYVVDRSGRIDRRYYELCALWELRAALRAGDVWLQFVACNVLSISPAAPCVFRNVLPDHSFRSARNRVAGPRQVAIVALDRVWSFWDHPPGLASIVRKPNRSKIFAIAIANLRLGHDPGRYGRERASLHAMFLAFHNNMDNIIIMVLKWGHYGPGYLARSTRGVYLAYDSLDCEMKLVRWYGIFERHSSNHSGERHRIDFGAFDALKSAQQACETHAQEFEA